MSRLVIQISFFHRPRATSEDVFEETPMRSTAQEIFTHGNERNEVRDGVGGKVMKLGSKEVLKTPEERMEGREKPWST